MTSTPRTSRPSRVWFLLSVALVTVAFIAAAPWLRETIGPDMVGWVAVAFAILVFTYGGHYVIRVYRSLDEVQKASHLFSAHWGIVVGAMVYGLLFSLPPVRDLAIDLVRDWAGVPDALPKVIIFSMTAGLTGMAIFQSIGILVVRAIWWKTKR